MKAGKYRNFITLERQSTTQDSGGQQVRTFTTLASGIPASIESPNGREYMLASGEKASITLKVSMRSRSDITPRTSDRISYSSRYFDIHAILPDPRGDEWVMMCSEAKQTT